MNSSEPVRPKLLDKILNCFEDPAECITNTDLEVGLAVGIPLLLLFSISVLICIRCHYKKTNQTEPAPKVITEDREVWSAQDRRMTSNKNKQSSLDDNYDDMAMPSAPRAPTMENKTNDARKAEEGNYFCEADDTAVYIEQ